jgi:YHS domain-containing protein
MKRLLALGLTVGLFALVASAVAATPAELAQAKKGLQELQEFIGTWKGSGGPDKPRPGPRDPIWSETIDWSWRFKKDDVYLTMQVKGSKHIKSGEMRYLPAKKAYQLTVLDPGGTKAVFEGKLIKEEVLVLERVDPKTRETQQLKMNLAAEGIRFIYRFARKAEGGTIWRKEYLVATTKKGESLGKREKGPVCIVSGGRGTMPVTYLGETYYVCCSGCADAFRENPKKYIDEFKARAGKK